MNKDDESGKMTIVPDNDWAIKTTEDLPALLDIIGILPNHAIECEMFDTRFTTKEDLKEKKLVCMEMKIYMNISLENMTDFKIGL